MNALIWLAVLLAVIWLLGVGLFEVVGFAIHLALVGALILLAIWAVQKVLGHRAAP